MMNGEYEFDNIFFKQGFCGVFITDLRLPVTSHLVYAFFVLVISMLLGNLLISLAVNEVQRIMCEAQVNRMKRTLDLISNIEYVIRYKDFLYHPRYR
jgi:hypothetical protein